MRTSWAVPVIASILIIGTILVSISFDDAEAQVMQLTSPSELSSGFATVDFEGLSGLLSNQIPGLTFSPAETSVADPAITSNSLGIPLSAATSGTAAGFSFGGSGISFDTPITEVGMFVSPSFITFISGLPPSFRDFSLVAFDSSGNEIGAVTVPVLGATGTVEDIENFSPVFLGLKSNTPISSVRVDDSFPPAAGGSSLIFDDLSFFPSISPSATIDPSADIGSGVTVGDDTEIEKNVQVGDGSIIGNNVVIQKNAVIGDRVTIGDNTEIEKNVQVGDDSIIGNNVVIQKDVVIGSGVTIGNNVVIERGVQIGDGATVSDGAFVPKDTIIAAGATFP